jgi:uncharacterized membrane protein
VKLRYLVQGLPGHPLHPPLTDATIGMYTFATVAALTDVLSITNHAGAQGWWLALIAGLIVTGLTALTGLIDWLSIEWGSELWKTATTHMIAMLSATVFFLLAAIFGHDEFLAGNVEADGLILTLVGFVLLTAGGWFGGAVVFVHGMRVLSLVDEPATRAVAPVPHPEKEKAEGV